jgi:hypothetical protein
MAKKRQKPFYKGSKKFKKFLEKIFELKKSVLVYFWSRSVDFIDFRVDTLWYKSCLGGHFILSTYIHRQNALPRNVEKILKILKLSRSLM